jgi:hypothetical protein
MVVRANKAYGELGGHIVADVAAECDASGLGAGQERLASCTQSAATALRFVASVSVGCRESTRIDSCICSVPIENDVRSDTHRLEHASSRKSVQLAAGTLAGLCSSKSILNSFIEVEIERVWYVLRRPAAGPAP